MVPGRIDTKDFSISNVALTDEEIALSKQYFEVRNTILLGDNKEHVSQLLELSVPDFFALSIESQNDFIKTLNTNMGN